MRLYTTMLFFAAAACVGPAPTGGEGSTPGNGASAPASVDARRLEADVRFLADDLLEGRKTGTDGFDAAALFVAERFRALGLDPGGDDGAYFQQTPLRAHQIAVPHGGTLTLEGAGAPADLEGGEDYIVYQVAGPARDIVEAPVVFVGFGLVAEEHGRDDYQGLDVDGKVVAFLSGAPKFLNSEARAHYGQIKAQLASERGAVGWISLITPTREEIYSFAQEAKGNEDASMTWREASGEGFSLSPNIRGGATLSLEGAEKLFADAPATWSEIVAAAEAEEGEVNGFEMGMTARIDYQTTTFDLESPNVIGVVRGTDPALTDEYVVLTAHLDHEGIEPTAEAGDDEIYNGALDNAVGVASVLEVARLLQQAPPRRSVMFIALTAEEQGLIGSDYFARNPTVPKDKIVANVNLDMPIATYEFRDVVAFGAERSTLYPIVEAAATRAGLALSPDPQPDEGFFTRSDQYSFVAQGIPAVYLDPGWAGDGEAAQREFLENHYHRQSDEIGLVNFGSLAKITEVNLEIARGVADADERPRWKKGDFFGETFGGPMEE